MCVIGGLNLARGLAGAVDALFFEEALHGAVDRIAEFLAADRRRRDLERLREARLLGAVFHHELGHRAATDVAVAHKKDPAAFGGFVHEWAPMCFMRG